MLNATYGAMLAMTYTNDMFTGYVFIEILTIASCTLILARGTKQAIVGTTHYLVFGCMYPVCSCWVFVFFMASQGSSYSRR